MSHGAINYGNIMISLVCVGNPQTPPKITVLKRRKPMGSHQNIDHNKWPEQSTFAPPLSRAKVCFHYDTTHTFGATVLRNDSAEPGEMLLQLDDGRVVRSVECMWSPDKTEAPHGWVCYNGGPGAIFWSPARSALEHELSEDIRPATAYEKALFARFGTKTSQGYMVEPDAGASDTTGASSPADPDGSATGSD